MHVLQGGLHLGDEISSVEFTAEDTLQFQSHLQSEMELLQSWFEGRKFVQDQLQCGLELEAWLIGQDGLPAPDNALFLATLDRQTVVPELSKFNFEFNVSPQYIAGRGLAVMESELRATWMRCEQVAAQLGHNIVAIGILPTVADAMLCVENLSPLKRYAALNERVLRFREGRPLHLRIAGTDVLESRHYDVMLEAAATSLQIHLKVPQVDSVRYYNASLIASTFTLAMAANAPLLFGHRLWDDTRIPLFEQAVDTGGRFPRVSFGDGFVRESLFELFQHNSDEHRVLLPVRLEQAPARMPYVRMHNGTIWNWNRPLIGFEEDGQPHLRIEHRPLSASPTLADLFADVGLYLGLVHYLATMSNAPEASIEFDKVRHNFYAAAQFGLQAEVYWLDGKVYGLAGLLADQLLPVTLEAMSQLGIETQSVERYQAVLEGRIESRQNGATWQRRAFEHFLGDRHQILAAYLSHQHRSQPVHTWPVKRA
jgi:gamma-glutamyl:cysteine ligase YbdK (ATP-grasp superfamily)